MLVAVLFAAQMAAARPPECGTSEDLRGTNVWERAKHPELRRYCDLLASGASKLAAGATLAREVVGIADEADRLMPGHAAPLALRGRALAHLGQFPEAYASFVEARKRDPRAVDDPSALYAFARSAARTGHEDEARGAFRALLPRAAGLLPYQRGPAYVEAAVLAMARGPAGLEEAIAIFRQARREAVDVVQALATLGLALALERSGATDESRATLDDRARALARSLTAGARARDWLGPHAAEADAMAAVGLAGTDDVAARAAWKRYLDGAGKTPWVEQATAAMNGPAKKKGRGHR